MKSSNSTSINTSSSNSTSPQNSSAHSGSKSNKSRRSRHQHTRSSSQSRSTLPGIDETKNMDKIELTPKEDTTVERRGSRSTIKSLQKIKEYEGNEDINHLRKLYKQQHKMKQKLQRLRNRSLMSFPAPPKPSDIESFLDDKTRYMLSEGFCLEILMIIYTLDFIV